MFQPMVFLFATIFLTAQTVTADIVKDCRQDQQTALQIKNQEASNSELKSTPLVQMGDWVGTIFYKVDGSLDSLFLCGNNPNSYYLSGNLNDLSKDQSQKNFKIFNDEYDIEVLDIRYIDLAPDIHISFKINVTFSGDPENSDYPAFATALGFYILE